MRALLATLALGTLALAGCARPAADDDEPGMAWGYAHVNGFRVAAGQHVAQGTELARVHFRGLEHTHLDRLRLRPGGSWQVWEDMSHLQPDTFFVYRDTEPPVYEGRFRYVRDGSDTAFLPPASGGPVVVSGDVDIVVGLRDPGAWARSKPLPTDPAPGGLPPNFGLGTHARYVPDYGDRNAPNRVEYATRRDTVRVAN